MIRRWLTLEVPCLLVILLVGRAGWAVADVPDIAWCSACSPYGDGSDGNVVITGHVDLTRDMNYINVTVNAGGTLDTNGYTVRVCARLWVASGGKITDTSSGGTGGAGGAGGTGANPNLGSHPLGCPTPVSQCRSGQAGSAGVGRGGRGGGGGGGGGGAWEGDDRTPDADGGDGATGGRGGRGGGRVVIYAYKLENYGTIEADGGRGDDGEDAPPGDDGDPGSGHYENCGAEYYHWGILVQHDVAGGGGGGGGGGCGGNGGIVEVYHARLVSQGQIHANGGPGGYGGVGGTRGGCLDHGADGSHQSGCSGGAACGVNNCGHGGMGGRGAHVAGDCSQPGGDGYDGCAGANVAPSVIHYKVCMVPDDYPTIQAAIDDETCAMVVIANGVYGGTGNCDIDFHGRNITVQSQSGNPEACVIDCEDACRGFYFHTGENACAVVQGIGIRNGYAPEGAGIFILYSAPTINNCTICGCSGSEAIAVYGGSATITRCQVTGNADGAMSFFLAGRSTVHNCTVAGNGLGAFAGGLSFFECGDDTEVQNSIVWGNCGGQIWCGGPARGSWGCADATCCDVQGGFPGTNNIDADPLFWDPEPCASAPTCASDYRLRWCSPCAAANQPVCGRIGARVDVAGPRTYVVKPDGSGDFATIQEAIDAACDGDEIVLDCDATYSGEGNRNIDFKGKAITVRSACGDPVRCVIDCAGPPPVVVGRGFYFHSGEEASSVIDSITIRNGFVGIYPVGRGGAILCENNSSPTIHNCRIMASDAASGGGIYVAADCHPAVSQCVISGNYATWGGGVYGAVDLTHCTIAGNTAYNTGGGIWGAAGPTYTIIWSNCAPTARDWWGDGGCYVECCNDYDPAGLAGFGSCVDMCIGQTPNINADPRFCDLELCSHAPTTCGDYHLCFASPCATGPGTCGLIGALPVAACTVCRGDLNCDGSVNFGDINPFVLVLSNPSAWEDTYPCCPILNGDINGDCLVNFADINPFVSLLSTSPIPQCD